MRENGHRFQIVGEKLEVFAKDPRDLLSALLSKIKLEHFSVRRATLEDVFLFLTGRELRE